MFCSQCGNQDVTGSFCGKCGAQVAPPQQPGYQQPPVPPPAYQPPPQQSYQPPPPPAYQPPPPAYQPPPQQQYQPPPPPGYQPPPYPGGGYAPRAPVPHYAPGSFVEMLHKFAGGILFLVGICLFSAGSLFGLFVNFTPWSILAMLLLALPVTGFWLIFAASKMPRLPEKTMPALTLFKVSIIIDMVLRFLIGLLMVIASIIFFMAASDRTVSYYGGSGIFLFFGIFSLLFAGGIVTFSILYFKSASGVMNGIKSGIAYNYFNPLPGIKMFTILTYIGVGLAVLSTIIPFVATGLLSQAIRQFPGVIGDFVWSALNVGSYYGTLAISALFTLMANGGVVVCVVALNQFNNSISYGRRQ